MRTIALCLLVLLAFGCKPGGTEQDHPGSATNRPDSARSAAGKAVDGVTVRLIVYLRDGSQLVGTPEMASLPFRTDYGNLSVSLDKVRSVTTADSGGASTLELSNGDIVHGRLGLEMFRLESAIGSFNLRVRDIVRILPFGSGAAITNGLVAYYPLDGSAADASGHGLDAVNHGALPAKNHLGNPDHAFFFNGSGAYISLPGGLIDRSGPAFSISFWALAQSLNDTRFVIEIALRGGEGKAWVVIRDRQMSFGLNLGDTGYLANVPADSNTFAYFTCIYRRGNSMQLWVNGGLAKEIPLPDGDLGHPGMDAGSTIGSYAPEEVNHARANHYWTWHGIIDDLRFYNRALEPGEIATLSRE